MVSKWPEVVLQIAAAQAAWWDFDTGMLRKLAGGVNIQLEPNLGLIDVLLVMTTKVLKVSNEEGMNILARRLVRTSSRDSKSMKLLSEVDEAQKRLNQEYEEVLQKELVKVEKLFESDKACVHAFKVKRQEVRSPRNPRWESGAGW